MATTREDAMQTVRHLKIAEPRIARLREERTLNVVGERADFDTVPPFAAARMALRAALENGCTKITVHQGVHRSVDFDVMTLLQMTRAMNGGVLHGPTHALPADYATASHLAMGNVFETTRPSIAVPSTAPFPILAGKE